jgi:hypothetical protein
VFSAMENCNCFKPWHDRATGRTYLKAAGGAVCPSLLLLHR